MVQKRADSVNDLECRVKRKNPLRSIKNCKNTLNPTIGKHSATNKFYTQYRVFFIEKEVNISKVEVHEELIKIHRWLRLVEN